MLRERTALVTGGGRGIGRAIAERLAAEGAKVLVAGRTQCELDAVAEATGGRALALDVADRAAVAALAARLEAEGVAVDVLVNNAGIAESAPLERTTDALWDRMLAVNVGGAFALTRALLPAMTARRWGRVINVASNAGLTGYAYSAAYCASKHALVGMTRAVALEVARSGVTVNCVCPGFVATRIADEAAARIAEKTGRSEADARSALAGMSPQKRLIEPEEVAHVVASLCDERARGIHGQAIALDGGQVMA